MLDPSSHAIRLPRIGLRLSVISSIFIDSDEDPRKLVPITVFQRLPAALIKPGKTTSNRSTVVKPMDCSLTRGCDVARRPGRQCLSPTYPGRRLSGWAVGVGMRKVAQSRPAVLGQEREAVNIV